MARHSSQGCSTIGSVADELTYVRARTLREALDHLAGGGARIVAGGTDLDGALSVDGERTHKVVSIAGLDDLRGIHASTEGVRIGALTPLAAVAASPHLTGPYVALARAASCAGPPESLLQATIGGNLCQRPRCWYLRSENTCVRKGGDLCFAADGESAYHAVMGSDLCHMVHPSDVAPPLVAFGAVARIAGQAGTRTVPFGEFFLPPSRSLMRENVLGPSEILTDVLVPHLPPGSTSAYRRVSESGIDYALASVAVAVIPAGGAADSVRIVLGAAAPIPWRATAAEAVLSGFQVDRSLITRAVDAAMAEAVPLPDNRYKVNLFKALMVDALEEAWQLRPAS
jgi:xanthine dehydrogenase YagS FAD-binding subunit